MVGGLRVIAPEVHHFTLIARPETLAARIRQSGEAVGWRMRQLQPCATTLAAPDFATHIATDGRTPEAIAALIVCGVSSRRPGLLRYRPGAGGIRLRQG